MHVPVLLLVFGPLLVQCQSSPGEYLWQAFINVPLTSLDQAFLPNYVNFERDILDNANITFECRQDLRTTLRAFKKRHRWAFQLFNAWGSFPPTGSLAGSLTDYGDYDQCMDINKHGPQLETEYCLVDVAVPMPPMPKAHNYYQTAQVLPRDPLGSLLKDRLANNTVYRHFEAHSSVFYYVYARVGICLPASCARQDVELVARKESHEIGLELKRVACERPTKWRPNFVQIVALLLAATSVVLAIVAALVDRLHLNDHHHHHHGSGWKQSPSWIHFLVWFSPVRNTRKLMSTKSHEELSCVHGLRFVTMVWIIIAHTLEWNNLNTFRDTLSIRDKLSALGKQPIYKGHYTVDTFFYLSGMLTSYVTLKYTNGLYKNFKFMQFLLLRYLRLTPQLGVFLVLTSLVPVMFDGPLWPSYIGKVTDKCYLTWWHNIIYLHNMIDIQNICAIHTWYLSADMQLHWMSLLPVVVLLKNRAQGIQLARVVIVLCLLISAITLFWKELPPGSVITAKNDFLDEDGRPSEFIKFFYQPWTHANVFFIGFIFGAFIRNLDLNNYVLSKTSQYLCWLVAFGGYLFCMYSTLPWLYGRAYDPVWSAIIFPLNSTMWALVLTLVIWLCITKNGSIVGRLLSWSGFRPLGRMTYSVYLTHAWACWVALGTRRDLIDLSTRSLVLMFAGNIVVSYVVGFLFTILFDTPTIYLIDYLKNNWIDPKAESPIEMADDSARRIDNANNNAEQQGEGKLLKGVTTAIN